MTSTLKSPIHWAKLFMRPNGNRLESIRLVPVQQERTRKFAMFNMKSESGFNKQKLSQSISRYCFINQQGTMAPKTVSTQSSRLFVFMMVN